jgi:hypothetical protein
LKPNLDTPAGLFAGYAGPPGAFDEMKLASGELRPHWQPLVSPHHP